MIKNVKNPSERQVVVGKSFTLHRRLEWLDKRIASTKKFIEDNRDNRLFVTTAGKRLSEQQVKRLALVSEIKRAQLRIEALIA